MLQGREKAERRIIMASTDRVIKEVANLVRKTSSRDPFEICRQKKINVRYHFLGDIKAYYFSVSRIRNIVINESSNDVAKKILCAHELGHVVLHEDIASKHGFHESTLFDATTHTEYEANLFAAELLISDEEILEHFEGDSFFEIAKKLSVSPELIDFKCKIMRQKGFDINVPSLSRSDFLKNKKI